MESGVAKNGALEYWSSEEWSNGVMEYWSNGKTLTKKNGDACAPILHYSITPKEMVEKEWRFRA
jgi:hypothetical protein